MYTHNPSPVPRYCLLPEDLPVFMEIVEHVFAGHLDLTQRARILLAGYQSDPSSLLDGTWPERGRLLKAGEDFEDFEIECMEGIPGSLPIYRGIGFLGMALAGMALLDGDALVRTQGASLRRSARLKASGMPSLRQIAAYHEDLVAAAYMDRDIVASSLLERDRDLLRLPRRVLLASPDNLLEMSKDAPDGKPRIGARPNEWHALVLEPDEEGNWPEFVDDFSGARIVASGVEMTELLRGAMPVVWGDEDADALLDLLRLADEPLPSRFRIARLEAIIRYVDESATKTMFELATSGTANIKAPGSMHALIAAWPRLPSEWMAQFYEISACFNQEAFRLQTPTWRENSARMIGPALHQSEVADWT